LPATLASFIALFTTPRFQDSESKDFCDHLGEHFFADFRGGLLHGWIFQSIGRLLDLREKTNNVNNLLDFFLERARQSDFGIREESGKFQKS
jgi:hypothetical protein